MKVKYIQYRGKKRDDLKRNFTTPELMLEKLSNIDFNLADKGNAQHHTTKNVLCQISSEINRSNSSIKCELYKLMVCIQSGETDTYGSLVVSHKFFQLYMIDDNSYEILKDIPEKSLTLYTDVSG